MAAEFLIEALNLRRDYMERIGNAFPRTTRDFLSGHYPKNLPKYRKKNTESCKFIFRFFFSSKNSYRSTTTKKIIFEQ